MLFLGQLGVLRSLRAVGAFLKNIIISLVPEDRFYAENNQGINVISFNCFTVAVYCVIALLQIVKCPEDIILLNALMHGTVNTGHCRILN